MSNREELIKDLVKKCKRNSFNYELKSFLKSKGLEESEMDDLIKEAKVLATQSNSKIVQFTWGAIGLIAFFIFFFFISPSVWNRFSTVVSIVGGGIIGISIFQAIGGGKLLRNNDPDNSKKSTSYIVGSVVAGIAFMILFVVHSISIKEGELLTNGVRTKGVILEGYSKKSRRSTSYVVKIKYDTPQGMKVIKESVTSNQYSKLSKGQEVDIIYSKNDPSIVELLVTKGDIETYTKIEERDISISDLKELIGKEKNEITEALNNIRLGWKYDDSENIWVNERLREVVSIENNLISYFIPGYTQIKFDEQFLNLGLEKITEDKEEPNPFDETPKLFISEDYLGTIEVKMLDSKSQEGLRKMERYTVITLGKTR